LVKIGGKMLAMKGPKVTEELPAAREAIRILGGGEPVIHPVALDGTDRHVIVEIPKRTKTSDKFPRSPSEQKGKSLKGS
jgi:16S rRNA (guanine527-N7)-methyltransferase